MDFRLIYRILLLCVFGFVIQWAFAASRQAQFPVTRDSLTSQVNVADSIQTLWFESSSSHWIKTPIRFPEDDSSPRAQRFHREKITAYNYVLSTDYFHLLKSFGVDSIGSFHSIPAGYLRGSIQSIQQAVQADTSLHLHQLHKIIPSKSTSHPEHSEEKSISGGGLEYGASYSQLASLGIPELQEWDNLLGDGVKIGVLDDGFDLQHRCFKRMHVAAYKNFVVVTSKLSRWLRTKEQGAHGTGVLSLMAGYDPGHLIGGAPFAEYLLARVFDERNARNNDELSWAVGLEWCEEQGADIIQSSLTFEEPEPKYNNDALYSRVAAEIHRRGVILVCAAGNEGPQPGTITEPSASRSLISVAALNADGGVADFSSRGPTFDGERKPDLAAQGSNMLIANMKPPNFYGHEDGTSYAAPLISSAFALLCEEHPDWNADRIESAMIASCEYAPTPDNRRGYGTPWLPAALRYPQLTGTITNASGKPMRDIEVLLVPVNKNRMESLLSTKSNEKGEFNWNTVETGSYWLWVPPVGNPIPVRYLEISPAQSIQIQIK